MSEHGYNDRRIAVPPPATGTRCPVCPRFCRLHEGQRGLCFVRARDDDALVLTTYGRSWFEDEARIGQKNKITRRWPSVAAARPRRPINAPHRA